MEKERNVVRESTEVQTTNKYSVQLKDGTVLNLLLNGTEYESETKIDRSIFTAENLSDVTVNGEKQGQMVLHSYYDFGEGTRFTLRGMTETERLQAENTSLQMALAEVFEMLLNVTM